MLKIIANFIERWLRIFIIFITNYLPVKVIRDDQGVPFLYRYHLFVWGNDGPGLCIHHFVKSDPDRGFHDHPWKRGLSFILGGGYEERILMKSDKEDPTRYTVYHRNRWTFNYLDGENYFHRVMIDEGKDAWTLFAFQRRSKTWGMVSLAGEYKPMSTTVTDQDGGWWNKVIKGLGLHARLPHRDVVVAAVDIVVTYCNDVLLIKRGKHPYKDCWALPGGRIENKDKDIETAAKRELLEETNIEGVPLTFVRTVGNNTRDPRGFCLTCIYKTELPSAFLNKVRAGDDAVGFTWMPLDEVNTANNIAFDHKEIILAVIAK